MKCSQFLWSVIQTVCTGNGLPCLCPQMPKASVRETVEVSQWLRIGIIWRYLHSHFWCWLSRGTSVCPLTKTHKQGSSMCPGLPQRVLTSGQSDFLHDSSRRQRYVPPLSITAVALSLITQFQKSCQRHHIHHMLFFIELLRLA